MTEDAAADEDFKTRESCHQGYPVSSDGILLLLLYIKSDGGWRSWAIQGLPPIMPHGMS